MEQYIRNVSNRAELFIVVLLAFGYFMFGSILSALHPTNGAQITDIRLQYLILYEVIVGIILWKILYIRKWKYNDLGVVPRLRDPLIGIGIFILTYIANIFIWDLFSSFVTGFNGQENKLVKPNLGLITVIFVSIINPIFEEVFVCGYLISALKKSRGMSFAINVSVTIRLVYHLYQGTLGVISIIPLGFIFAYWYAKSGRLLPVIVAHALFDFIALMTFVKL